jgi:uncharacterized protein (TIGR02452 family)
MSHRSSRRYDSAERRFRIQIVEENNDVVFPAIVNRYPEEMKITRTQTKLYPEVRKLEVKVPVSETRHNTIVEVLAQDTLDAAWVEIDAGYRPLVLNMASDRHAGGGYQKGSMAQEEELFRRTTLALGLENNPTVRYPLRYFNAIYTPKVLVFRSTAGDNYGMFKWKNCCWIDVVSVAAIRNPRLNSQDQYSDKDLNIMYEKIRGIFKVGLDQGHDCLLLSALGCGAFHNPPEEVAQLFRKVVDEFNGLYKKITFAILDRSGYNYRTFKRVLEGQEEVEEDTSEIEK